MGSYDRGIFLPSFREQGWDDEVNANFSRLADLGINVKAAPYGAKGDGTTDDTAAIQAALTALDSGDNQGDEAIGGDALLPAGVFVISSTLVVPIQVTLRGVGRRATTLKAAPGFAGPLVRIRTFHSRVEHLNIDCNGEAGSIAVQINESQEQSGVYSCLIRNYVTYGINCDSAGGILFPQNFDLADLELYPLAGNNGAISIRLNNAKPRLLQRITCNGGGAAGYGIRAVTVASNVACSAIHVENVGTGVEISTGWSVHGLTDGPSTTTAVSVPSGVQAFVLSGINGSNSTNAIVDTDRSFSSGAAQIPLYAVGNGALGSQMILNGKTATTTTIPNLTTGALTANGSTNLASAVRVSGKVSDSSNTDQADWAIASTASWVRWTGNANILVHGIASPTDGRLLFIEVVGGFALTLKHDSATETTAANRILLPGSRDMVLNGIGSVLLIYDGTSSRWRAIGTPPGTASVIATASLPAASASMNGQVLIEDNGTGDRNLIIYAGGQRFRIDGGAAF